MINAPDEGKSYTLDKAQVVSRDPKKYHVYMDLSVMYEIAKECKESGSLGYDALYKANAIINHLILRDHSDQSYTKAIKMAQEFFNVPGGQASRSRDTIHAIGNCHIDCAWLWPYRETIR